MPRAAEACARRSVYATLASPHFLETPLHYRAAWPASLSTGQASNWLRAGVCPGHAGRLGAPRTAILPRPHASATPGIHIAGEGGRAAVAHHVGTGQTCRRLIGHSTATPRDTTTPAQASGRSLDAARNQSQPPPLPRCSSPRPPPRPGQGDDIRADTEKNCPHSGHQ
jgi:hypothetical protein